MQPLWLLVEQVVSARVEVWDRAIRRIGMIRKGVWSTEIGGNLWADSLADVLQPERLLVEL